MILNDFCTSKISSVNYTITYRMMSVIVTAKQKVAYHLAGMVPMNATTLCQIHLQTAI